MNNELMDGRPRPPSEPSRPGSAPFIPPPTPAPWDAKPAPWHTTETHAPLGQVPWDRPQDEWPQVDLAPAHATLETAAGEVMDARAGYAAWDSPPRFGMGEEGFVDDRPAAMLDAFEEFAGRSSALQDAPPTPPADAYDSDAPILPDVARQAPTPAWPSWDGQLRGRESEIEPQTPAPWATDSPVTTDAVQSAPEPSTHQLVATVPISSAALGSDGSPANLVLRIELAIVEDGNRPAAPVSDSAARTPVESAEPEPTELSEWPSVWEPAIAEAFAAPRASPVAARRLAPRESDQFVAAEPAVSTVDRAPEAPAQDRPAYPLLTAGLTVGMAVVVVFLVLVFVQLMTSLLR